MHRPILDEYGISEAEAHKWRQWIDDDLPKWGLSAAVSAMIALAVFGYRNGGIAMAIALAVLLGGGFALLSGLIFGAIIKALVAGVEPGLRAFSKYTADLERYERWEKSSRAEYWVSLSGVEFERALGALFRSVGYSVIVTPPSGDQGIDLVISRGDKSAVVQCKATRQPIGPGAMRELYGSMLAVGAEVGIMASLSGVSSGAREFARGKPLIVMGLSDVLSLHAGHDPIDLSKRPV